MRDLIADTLNISDDFYLERAHRLGRFKPGSSKPRPIIVAFRDYYDTEVILQQVQSLKGTNYAVCRDYPREITEARNTLWPHYRKARETASNKVSIKYPARLIVNGHTTHDMFPDWFNVMKRNRVQQPGNSSENTQSSDNHNGNDQANGHPMNIETSGHSSGTQYGPVVSDTHINTSAGVGVKLPPPTQAPLLGPAILPHPMRQSQSNNNITGQQLTNDHHNHAMPPGMASNSGSGGAAVSSGGSTGGAGDPGRTGAGTPGTFDRAGPQSPRSVDSSVGNG